MNIEDKIKEVAEYFRQKVLTGDYMFVSCSEHTAEILVDEKYKFSLWIANEPKMSFDFYEPNFLIEDPIELLTLKTQKERLQGWKHIKPYIKDHKNKVLKREKQKQFNRLKKELEKLNNDN
jgi:hypothetical protein